MVDVRVLEVIKGCRPVDDKTLRNAAQSLNYCINKTYFHVYVDRSIGITGQRMVCNGYSLCIQWKRVKEGPRHLKIEESWLRL